MNFLNSYKYTGDRFLISHVNIDQINHGLCMGSANDMRLYSKDLKDFCFIQESNIRNLNISISKLLMAEKM